MKHTTRDVSNRGAICARMLRRSMLRTRCADETISTEYDLETLAMRRPCSPHAAECAAARPPVLARILGEREPRCRDRTTIVVRHARVAWLGFPPVLALLRRSCARLLGGSRQSALLHLASTMTQ